MKDMNEICLNKVIEILETIKKEVKEDYNKKALQIAINILNTQNKDYSEYEDNMI
ncbi:MAG: hypothetical protein ACOC56_03860 [Atribacterota bacterium]